MCYNKSMKRIDVLKGIEQILVQKAYETGHISHRADGDWQKQADGSWKPYKGQSSQSTPQTQEPAPTENTGYGEITEEDLKGSNTTDTSNIDTKEKKRDVQNKIHGVFNLRDEDTKKMLGIRRDDSNEHGYDGEVRFYADGSNIKPASDRKEFDKVVQYYLDKAGLEDTPFNHKVAHQYIVGYAKNNSLIGDYYWSKVLYPSVYGSDDEKEVRDMRSAPTTKNTGF